MIMDAVEHGVTYLEKVHDLVMEERGEDLEDVEAIGDPEDEFALIESTDTNYGFNTTQKPL